MHPFSPLNDGPGMFCSPTPFFPMEDHDVKTYFEALELSIDDVFWRSLTWATKKTLVGWII